MNGIGFVLVMVLVVIGAIAAMWYGHLQAQKRREALAALAAKLGWSFDPDQDSSLADRYPRFGCFSRGHSRAAYNTLEGERRIGGRAFPARMGDYTYKVTTSNGKTSSTRTYRFSYVIIRVPWPVVPDLLIRREGMLDKLKGAMGFDDIDFESEEFSRRFWVKSADKKFAYDVVSPRMMEFLLSGDSPPIELCAGSLCLADGTRVWQPGEFESRLAWMDRFFGLWPEHLTSALEARA
jgi:hypothetical protein